MISKKRLISATFLCLLSGCALASANCNQERERLIDNVLSLCATYESIYYLQSYLEARDDIEENRVNYYMCKKNKKHSSSTLIDNYLFVTSKYVLGQIDFYLKLREERKEDLEVWSVEKMVVSKAVDNDCGQLSQEIKMDK